MITLEQLLAPFRAQETNESAVAMFGDDEMIKVFLAWQKAPGTFTMPKRVDITGGGQLVWAWLVTKWKIDHGVIAAGAGVTEEVARAKLAVLQHNRLIYPDGSHAGAAKLAVQAHMARRLGIKPGRSKKTEE